MNILRSKKVWVIFVVALVFLFWLRPGMYRFRGRIGRSIASAVGRPVTIENVHLHFLPRPGFDLDGLIIRDDPQFSAEPLLRAQEVNARLSISALFRGRLEIATLSANEPSINLVRNADGMWNLTALVQRNSQIPAAPTGQAATRRPSFPYIEATNARVNFKIGQEKKSYALSDADLSLWQDSDNSWGARLRAQPIRTDFNLTDTGLVHVNVAWQRASHLEDTPVQASFQWDRGQLGQISKLLSGRDSGWRGGVTMNISLSGTVNALAVKSQLSVDDFRRFDISEVNSIRLATSCSARYSAGDRYLRDLACISPVGNGVADLLGTIGPFNERLGYDLRLRLKTVPAASVVEVLRRAKRDLPRDLQATGTLNADLSAKFDGHSPVELRGGGSTTAVKLISDSEKQEVSLGTVPFVLAGARQTVLLRHSDASSLHPSEAHLQIGPFPLAMGAPGAASAGGSLTTSSYSFFLRGDSEIKNLLRLEILLGLPGFRPALAGAARVDLSVGGEWRGFAPPVVSGVAELRSVQAEVPGFNVPVQIASASVAWDHDAILIRRISARTGDTHWNGFATIPRGCHQLDCTVGFDLSADHLSSANIAEWLTPPTGKRPWYRLLSRSAIEGPSPLRMLRADGTVHVGRFVMKKAVATKISGVVGIDRGKIALTGLQAQVFDGNCRADWAINASVSPPEYQATGSFQGVSLAQLTAAVDNPWVTGSADGRLQFQARGSAFRDALAHSEGTLQIAVQNGTLNTLELGDVVRPFPLHSFRGELKLKAGAWDLKAGKLESRNGIYRVSGGASAAGALSFVLVRGDEQKWNVTGTLSKPIATPAARTEARANPRP